jgi:endonuclease/exonuclease/phosphatase family metal-dependent hydrolase
MSQLPQGSFSLSVIIDFDQGHESCCFTGVYGPQADVDKVEFLDELRSIHSSISCPWLIADDFNLILDAMDKNNANLNRRNMGRFRRFVDETELKDLPLHGCRYTWSNGCAHPTLEKLDRVLASADWESLFPESFLQALSSDMSDHTPLLLATNAAFRPKRRFHFENY